MENRTENRREAASAPTQNRRHWHAPAYFFLLMTASAGFAYLVARATAPDDGFSPFVIESPRPAGEPRGYEQRQSVARLGLRARDTRIGSLILNAGDHYIFAPERGIVSWYGYNHIGRLTATGDMFNPEALTAAHKSLPFGSLVRVIREDRGREDTGREALEAPELHAQATNKRAKHKRHNMARFI